MKTLPIALLVALTTVLSGACGSDDGGSADGDTTGLEVVFPDASPTQTTDTRTAEDAPETSPIDTGETVTTDTADDTGTPDTFVADTSDPEDTAVVDTFVPDTAVPEDTSIVDTSVVDTSVVDTLVADTSVPEDTTVVDTNIEKDTANDDTAEPACQLGGCETDVTTAGNNCTNAYVIGRPNAQTGFGHQGSTVGAGNDSDFPQAACGDSGPDRFYRIYLKVGEQLWANINPDPASFDVTFGLYRGAGCETPVTCVDNDVSGTTPDSMPYQAVEEGWHVLVVDGRGTQGSYSLVVTLDCHEDDCCCE